MACGCAYIGYDKIDYSQYGLIQNKDYITYDGTIEDLKRVISYYKDHEQELKVIADNGGKMIRSNASKDKIEKHLFDHLLWRN